MANTHHCPALFIAAPASGQGKTTLTAALARYHRQRGRNVRVFKTGPDYLDPLVLAQAAGTPVEPLDLWLVGEEQCRKTLYDAAAEADLILIEGVMGLFDGDPSGADLATAFGIPVAVVMDAGKMAQTIAPLAQGLAQFRPAMPFAGIIANRVNTERHRELIATSLEGICPFLGAFPATNESALPERHLGLVMPSECNDYDQRLDQLASTIAPDSAMGELPASVAFHPPASQQPIEKTAALQDKPLQGRHIAIARDAAFCFIYAANLQLLQDLGATLSFFSPLQDDALPQQPTPPDALWLPGGYPELHLEHLSGNRSMAEAIRDHEQRGGTIVAECGGMLYLQQRLTTLEGQSWPMVGLLPGEGVMRERGGCQGMQTAPLPEGDVRAHAHHRSKSVATLPAIAHGRRKNHPAPGEAIVRKNGLTATYLHLYFPSNPMAVAKLFDPRQGQGRD